MRSVSKLPKGSTTSTSRKVPREAEHGPSNCTMLPNCPQQRPAWGFEQNPDSHPHHQAWVPGVSFKKALHLSEERMLTIMSGGALPVRKDPKTEALGGPLSPGTLNLVSACNERNSTRIENFKWVIKEELYKLDYVINKCSVCRH